MGWLKKWAAAVAEASLADTAERSQFAGRGSAPYHPGVLSASYAIGNSRQSPATEVTSAKCQAGFQCTEAWSSTGLEGSRGLGVQARRRAMKAAIRQKYAFRGTAKLWAAEIESS